jgi:DNA-binding HxlR family transcriptional regulator
VDGYTGASNFEVRVIASFPEVTERNLFATLASERRPTPTAALFDLLGRRWALRILWELRDEPASFQALQGRCDSMSPSVLSQRLTELRDAALGEKDDGGAYRLTQPGRTLLDRLRWVEEWTAQWGAGERPRTRRRPSSS